MRSRSTKSRAKGEGRGNEGGEDLYEFLVRELPPVNTKQAAYFTNALREAGARYDRYAARRNDWRLYASRRKRLEKITKSAKELTVGLCELDILSRDDLESRIGPKGIEALVGSLLFLSKETTDLAKETQEDGSPRDLAFERWIVELADIYENAFCKPARVWGSGDGPVEQRGNFYRLLEVSRPISFPRHGKLSLRQIDRTLKRGRKLNPGTEISALMLPPSSGAETE